MKHKILSNLLPLTIILFLFICIFYSCKKDPSTPSSSMTASVAGQSTTFSNPYSFYSTHSQFMEIGGQTSGDNYYALRFYIANCPPSYIGTYHLGNNTYKSNASYATYSYNTAWIDGSYLTQWTYSTDSIHDGVLTITSYDPNYQNLSGTFTLTLYDYSLFSNDSGRISITNGTFFSHLQTSY